MEPFLMSKAADFSATALGKATSVVIKGLLVLGIIALIAWSVYVTVVRPHTKPTPTTSNAQTATTIVNNNYNCKSLIGWGCGKK